jgi:hypothetical protein
MHESGHYTLSCLSSIQARIVHVNHVSQANVLKKTKSKHWHRAELIRYNAQLVSCSAVSVKLCTTCIRYFLLHMPSAMCPSLLAANLKLNNGKSTRAQAQLKET